MIHEIGWITNIFPDKKKLISLRRFQDKFFGEVVGNDAFLVVVHYATLG